MIYNKFATAAQVLLVTSTLEFKVLLNWNCLHPSVVFFVLLMWVCVGLLPLPTTTNVCSVTVLFCCYLGEFVGSWGRLND